MPVTPHIEKHFTATATVRDIVIGMADGLTVPFALAAGLSGAVASSGLVVTAGLAEIAAGSIAMGLGGYLAAKTDLEHYASERLRELRETQHIPEREAEEVSEIFRGYGLRDEQIAPLIETLQANPTQWVDFMMRFELGLEEPDPTRARISAWTIALSYVVGGLIPLLPYMVVSDIHTALWWSVAVTPVALFVFGYVKSGYTGVPPWRGGFQTVLVGGLAAAAAFGIARLLG
ncbi:MAG TPA: VIT1/CCC1 transporter family protein [Nitrospira sp.]|jgi:VIT1/CCC1 family predicted Fe2+/Mn2+ transporter|nr:VIT1/CCC1 transporter family protein [Nitrospira sp.]